MVISKYNNQNWLAQKKAIHLMSKKQNNKDEILALIPDMIATLENSENPNIRANVAQTLSKFGKFAEESVPALINSMKNDESKDVKQWSIIALGEIGAKAESAICDLIEIMNESDSPIIKKNAILALGKIGSKKILPALRKFKETNSDWWVNSMIDPIIQNITS
ncbi:MAG: HEAT repeat domain-containing protein [Candidatus Heimdallarchaeota archaeon]